MSAPIDISTNLEEIPNHHIRHEPCVTRPAYRDGRNPKAVKVYTINQESCYLLFQGVPAMGTTQELVKLCAIHGAVEEYRLLDEFPTVDKFTDVVLVKFKRIQSARHAKKKLDDWSFYGGVLHVSYAPEFESVEETREKLQDRRKAMAARLRMLGKGTSQKDRSRSLESTNNLNTDDQKNCDTMLLTERIESRIPSLTSHHGSNSQNHNVWHTQTFSNSASGNLNNAYMLHSQQGSQNESSLSTNNSWNSQFSQQRCLRDDHLSYTSDNNIVSDQTLVIPPPPKREPFLNVNKFKKTDQFDFARVPTANAPFPLNFDARKNTDVVINIASNEMSEERYIDTNKIPGKERNKSLSKPLTQETHANLNHPKYHKVLENMDIRNEKIVVKEFKKTGSTPKFIPRQTLNLLKTKSEPSKDPNSSDSLGKEIRKNAVVLGNTQGPALVPDEFKKPEKSTTEVAIEKSVTEIRKRMSEFLSREDDSSKRLKTDEL